MKVSRILFVSALLLAPAVAAQAQTSMPIATPAGTSAAPTYTSTTPNTVPYSTYNQQTPQQQQMNPYGGATPDQMQRYASMLNGQGAGYGPPGMMGYGQQQKQAPKQYEYKGYDPNDPVSHILQPERLFTDIPARNY